MIHVANGHDPAHLRRIAYKLRQNDAAFDKFYLPLDDVSDLADITLALGRNSTVKEVSIFCEYLDDDWLESPDVWRLFRAVGGLPKLERLVFDFIGSDGDELPLPLLTSIVSPAEGLERLELSCVHLTGRLEDFVAFARALRRKPVQKFQIYGCYLSEEMRGSAARMDPILEELAQLESLEDVQIAALDFESLGTLSPQSLGTLLHLGPRLENLVLGEFALDDQHLVAMSVAMENNRSLKELSFGCVLGAVGAEALATMLRTNQTLEILHLHIAKLEGGEAHHIVMARALETNRTLKRFSLYGTSGSLTSNTQQAYAKMLEHNYDLEELEFQEEEESVQTQIDMFLKLNAHGRGRLLRSNTTTRDDWIAVILQVCDDPDCVFHLISLNPAILSIEGATPQSGKKRKRS